jgi:Helix-turn-helix domain
MSETGAYGRRLGDRFQLENAPAFVAQTLRKTDIAVTQIKGGEHAPVMTTSIGYEDAFLVGFQVRECPDHELWLDGRPVPVEPFAAGCTSFYDLKSDPIAYMRGTLSRAFRQSIGLPPHQWLLQRRVDKAKQLLRDSRSPLAEVAADCGFADQSHFTRVFTRAVGISPGQWRRARSG